MSLSPLEKIRSVVFLHWIETFYLKLKNVLCVWRRYARSIVEFAGKPSANSCCLDPISSTVFKGCFRVLLPTITKIVNMSLSTATMLKSLKTTVVSPRLKKPHADYNQFSNFRPVSNLCLISKIIEKPVAVQLTNHIINYHMDEMFQSAYKVFHSTETALVN